MESPSLPRAVVVGDDSEVDGFLRDAGGRGVPGLHILGRLTEDGSWPIGEFPERASAHGVSHVLVAPGVDGPRLRAILDACGRVRLRFRRIVPPEGGPGMPTLRDVEPDDLVRRARFERLHERSGGKIAGRRALVTGAAGTIGATACELLLTGGAESVVMVDRDARRLEELRDRLIRQYSGSRAVAEVVDIRDASRIRSLMDRHRPQDVVHAAAEKHLPELETAPCEAVSTNVIGTRHVVAAADGCGVERLAFISTDKAVRPTSVLGASKRIAEEIVRAADRRSPTRFVVVRFGNVIGSSRSVVPRFLKQIASGGPMSVTHPEVSRYFTTRTEAVTRVLRALDLDGGDLCVLDMGESIRILDLARYLIRLAGLAPGRDISIEFVGLRPGEKLHEDLLGPGERARFERSGLIAVRGPRPADGLANLPAGLTDAVSAGDAPRALEWLRRLVPGYRPRKRARIPVSRPGTRALVDDSGARS